MSGQFDEVIAKIKSAEPKPIPPELADLDGLIDVARQYAERILTENVGAELGPAWCIVTKNGASVIISTPFLGPESKEVIAQTMRWLMGQIGAVRYSMVSEAWASQSQSDLEVRKRDDRVEIVLVVAGDESRDLTATFEIVRDWETSAVTELKPLGQGEAKGRFCGLLGDS